MTTDAEMKATLGKIALGALGIEVPLPHVVAALELAYQAGMAAEAEKAESARRAKSGWRRLPELTVSDTRDCRSPYRLT